MIGLIIAAALAAEILLIIFLPVLAWSILGLFALLVLAVLLVPVGAHAQYREGEFSLSAKISAFEIKLYPKEKKKNSKPDEKKQSKKKEPSAPQAEATDNKKKLPFNFEELMALAQKALKSLGKFGKLTVHSFMLHYIAAGTDPYKTAMNFNYLNAALSSLAPVCAQNFNVKKDVDVWTNVDFTREKMFFEGELSLTLRLIQLVRVAIVFAFGALGILIKNRQRLRKEKKANIESAPGNNTNENKETNIKTEERMDSNGQ